VRRRFDVLPQTLRFRERTLSPFGRQLILT
jgi:hypothetical protein